MKASLKLIYANAKKECKGQSSEWVKLAINEILSGLTAQIKQDGKVPESEQLDRIETVLKALKDELKARGES